MWYVKCDFINTLTPSSWLLKNFTVFYIANFYISVECFWLYKEKYVRKVVFVVVNTFLHLVKISEHLIKMLINNWNWRFDLYFSLVLLEHIFELWLNIVTNLFGLFDVICLTISHCHLKLRKIFFELYISLHTDIALITKSKHILYDIINIFEIISLSFFPTNW